MSRVSTPQLSVPRMPKLDRRRASSPSSLTSLTRARFFPTSVVPLHHRVPRPPNTLVSNAREEVDTSAIHWVNKRLWVVSRRLNKDP